jgi:hypothetical protein
MDAAAVVTEIETLKPGSSPGFLRRIDLQCASLPTKQESWATNPAFSLWHLGTICAAFWGDASGEGRLHSTTCPGAVIALRVWAIEFARSRP